MWPSRSPWFLIVSLDRYLFVVSRFSIGARCHPHGMTISVFPYPFRSYENYAWIPVTIAFIITMGVCGKQLVDVPVEPATAAQIFNFGATIAGFTLTWAMFGSDYTVYFHIRASRLVGSPNSPHCWLTLSTNSWRAFIYSYLGLNIPVVGDTCYDNSLHSTSNHL